MADDISLFVQYIGHSVAAHRQIHDNIRQKISVNAAIYHAFKLSVDHNRNLKQKNQLLSVIHNIGNIRLPGCLALLKIILSGIVVACGGKAVRIYLARIKKTIAACYLITNGNQLRSGRLRFPEYIGGCRLLQSRPVVIHTPLYRVRRHLCGGTESLCHSIVNSAGI